MRFFGMYRKIVKAVLAPVLLAVIAGGVFYYGWNRYGVAEDRVKSDFKEPVFHAGQLVIYAIDRRVLQNEKVLVRELATARDENGGSLTEYIHFFNSEGRELSGYLDTSVPGKYDIKILAKNPATGKSVRKTICILVDGRIGSGRTKNEAAKHD